MIVVDASAAIALLLRAGVGERIARRTIDDGQDLHAPALIDLEVVQVLRRFVRATTLTSSQAAAALGAWIAIDLERHAHDALLRRIWALRANLTAYDAAYVALAEVLRAPLVTCDRKLATSSGHEATIEVFANDP
ncbi:MAG: type II toxin-antitoxin system VapC family toxin [Alphaproteobacteria bacterium]|nr:type II toxin-antitoxin system VapC family toxin [Alphaproteobacteria bacterium]